MTSCIFPVAVAALLLGAAHGLAVKCKCDCQGTELTCGKDLKTNALQTFKNPCQMICQNCVSSEKWVPVKSGDCDKVARTKRRLPPPTPPPSASPSSAPSTSPTLSKIIAASKQSAASPQKQAPEPVPPPKALASLLAKAVPSPPKSPNTPPPPHHSQQQSLKAQAIGG